MRRTQTMLIGDILKEFFERPYIAARLAEAKLPETWRTVVGDQVANMTSELRFDNGILHVKIESSLIRQELFYQREALKERINEVSKAKLVGAVIVR
ncbi:MAG: DUF721 domain-containing protein [Rikenellaceae bacterium]